MLQGNTKALGTVYHRRAVWSLQSILRKRNKDDKNIAKLGGFYCIANLLGQPLMMGFVGVVLTKKLARYESLAKEKALRLAFTSEHAGHMLSKQSREPELDRWGGAIVGKNFIWSFSGFAEHLDEMFAIIHACACKDLSSEAANNMAKVAHNEYYERYKQYLAPRS